MDTLHSIILDNLSEKNKEIYLDHFDQNKKYYAEDIMYWVAKNDIDALYFIIKEIDSIVDLTFAAEYYGKYCSDITKVKEILLPLLKHENIMVIEGVLYGLGDHYDEVIKKSLKEIYPTKSKILNNLLVDLLSKGLEAFA